MRLPQGCVLRALTAYGLFLLAVLGPTLGGFYALAAWRLSGEGRAWAQLGTPMDAFGKRFPPHGDSASARELDAIARRLGIRLVAGRAGKESQVEDRKLGDLMSRYAASLQKSSEDSLPALEPIVDGFLDGHRADLEAAADRLANAEDVSWEMNLDAGPDPPMPSLYAHRQLHALLVLEAVRRLRQGDGTGADGMLTAAWRQRRTLAGRPEVISQLISIGFAADELAVLRRWRQPPTAWKERLRDYRFRAPFVEALQADVYGWFVLTREFRGANDLDPGPRAGGLVDWGVRVATVPWLRFSAAGISSHTRRGRAMALADEACTRTSEALQDAVGHEIMRWDAIAGHAVPGLIGAWPSAVRADLDAELTALVLGARGHVPAAPVNVPSQVCRGMQWLHGPEPGGGSSLHAELVPDLVRESGTWTFTLARPAR